jgi:hypothetical protein
MGPKNGKEDQSVTFQLRKKQRRLVDTTLFFVSSDSGIRRDNDFEILNPVHLKEK